MTGLFFEIPLERFGVHPVLWYSWQTLWINGAPGEQVPLTPPDDEFETFDVDRYSPLPNVTSRQLTYLVSDARGGRPVQA